MILVADASALIALATCDSLMLLDGIFGNVFVPDAVYAEVTELDKPQSTRLRSYLQGKVREVDMKNFVYLDAFADVGETQAMLLYKTSHQGGMVIARTFGGKMQPRLFEFPREFDRFL